MDDILIHLTVVDAKSLEASVDLLWRSTIAHRYDLRIFSPSVTKLDFERSYDVDETASEDQVNICGETVFNDAAHALSGASVGNDCG